MVYGFALDICYPDQKEAENLLISTFKKIYKQDISQEKYPVNSIILMRLIIKTAQELYPQRFKNSFGLKQFENTPLLNQLFCSQMSLQDYCKEKSFLLQDGIQIMHKEFRIIRGSPKRCR